jgi:hypothetical protein
LTMGRAAGEALDRRAGAREQRWRPGPAGLAAGASVVVRSKPARTHNSLPHPAPDPAARPHARRCPPGTASQIAACGEVAG